MKYLICHDTNLHFAVLLTKYTLEFVAGCMNMLNQDRLNFNPFLIKIKYFGQHINLGVLFD